MGMEIPQMWQWEKREGAPAGKGQQDAPTRQGGEGLIDRKVYEYNKIV